MTEPNPAALLACRCQGHAHNALADRHPAPNGYCLQCPCTTPPVSTVVEPLGTRLSRHSWPDPYLQPDRTKDCGFYSVAYIGQCFGLDVSADDVKAWRAETNRHEDHYLTAVHGIPVQRPQDDRRNPRWWMGPDQREWVRGMLADSICLVHLLRIPTMHHSVVALEAHADGVMLMDPIYGHVVEPWDWFLGPGPKHGTNTHCIWSAHPRTWQQSDSDRAGEPRV